MSRDSSGEVGVVYPRMQPPEQVDERMLAFLRTTKFYERGRPLYAHQILSNHPRAGVALNRWLDWGDDVVLSGRERRMLILRTAAATSCSYEFNVHRRQGISTGDLAASEADELAVDAAPKAITWTPRELALLAIGDAVCSTDTLSDDQWRAACVHLAPTDIIECLCVIGYYRMCCAMMNVLAVPDEGDVTSATLTAPAQKD